MFANSWAIIETIAFVAFCVLLAFAIIRALEKHAARKRRLAQMQIMIGRVQDEILYWEHLLEVDGKAQTYVMRADSLRSIGFEIPTDEAAEYEFIQRLASDEHLMSSVVFCSLGSIWDQGMDKIYGPRFIELPITYYWGYLWEGDEGQPSLEEIRSFVFDKLGPDDFE